ncbi:MAG: FAD:protein FMN transferase [Pseudomonadota bacterium]
MSARGRQKAGGRISGRRRLWLPLLVLMALAGAVFATWLRTTQPVVHTLSGYTMGSTWSLRVVAPPGADLGTLRADIEAQLAELDRQLSNYRDDAVLARLNRAPVDAWQELPAHLHTVLRTGQQLHAESGGAFDLTVKPLVNLWGFGAAEPRTHVPDDAEIAAARALTGNDRLEISADGLQVRRRGPVTLDVDAVAPGHAADVITALLREHGLPDHLMEVGGELVASGRRPDGTPWRVGIEQPERGRGGIERVVAVSGVAIATSGDYRDYVDIAGQRYSHTIDPVTGRPVEHALTSVTVIAEDGLHADGYATVLMVLGPERGLAWADARRLPVFMIVRTANGERVERYNEAFVPFLVSP